MSERSEPLPLLLMSDLLPERGGLQPQIAQIVWRVIDSLCISMKRRIYIAGLAVFLTGLMLLPILGQQRGRSSQQELLSEYCLSCHNDRLKTGGLTLEQLDIDRPEASPEVWEKVIRKLRAGMMPRRSFRETTPRPSTRA